MADALVFSERVTGGGRVYDSDTSQTQTAAYGSGVLPSLNWSLVTGTGSGQANVWYLARRTLAATTYDLLDLAGGLTDYKGAAITMTHVKRVLVAVVDPDGSKKVRVGPQNQTNAWQGPWGGTGATVYDEVVWKVDHVNPYAGWAVTAGTGDVLAIYNPGASSLTYALWVIGRTA